MLARLLTSASRSLWEAHRCPVVAWSRVGVAATELASVSTPTPALRLRNCDSVRSMASTALTMAPQRSAVHDQRQLPPNGALGAVVHLPARIAAHRRHYSRLAVQCQAAEGLQRAIFCGRHVLPPPSGVTHRPHPCGGGSGSSRHHRWPPQGQLSAVQNFSLWSGRSDRSQDDSFDRVEEATDRRLLVNVSEEYALPQPLAEARKEKASLRRELHTVNVAIGTNFAIFLAKLGVFSFTGSNALFAEAIHSLADVANQALLWVGITRAKRKPTKLHPYGYMRDKFVFSLISAVGIFCLGAGVSVWHGCAGLIAAEPVEHIGWSVAVLALSLVLESASLVVAVRSVRAGAEAAGLSFMEYVRRGVDPTSVAVMMEDSGAVAGLLVAGACTTLVHFTGQVMWDSIGSICVGAMMGVTAWFLISRNRQMLIGRSMDSKDMQAIIKHLEADPVVEAVYDAKSEEIGPGIFRFKAEIDFLGEEVVQRHMNGAGRASLLRRIQAASKNDMELDHALKAYGEEIIGAVGAEVDRIETEIQRINPGVRYVDLETDRGQATTWPRARRVVTPSDVGVSAW